MSVQYISLAFLDYPLYCIGDDGSLWVWRQRRESPRIKRWKRLKGSPNSWGYTVVDLWNDQGHKAYRLHQLVLLVFVGPCPEGMEACHGPDRDPTNNQLTNLRYDTKQANAMDRHAQGTILIGADNPETKLRDDQVRNMRILRKAGYSGVYLARKYKVSTALVSIICSGKARKYIT